MNNVERRYEVLIPLAVGIAYFYSLTMFKDNAYLFMTDSPASFAYYMESGPSRVKDVWQSLFAASQQNSLPFFLTWKLYELLDVKPEHTTMGLLIVQTLLLPLSVFYYARRTGHSFIESAFTCAFVVASKPHAANFGRFIANDYSYYSMLFALPFVLFSMIPTIKIGFWKSKTAMACAALVLLIHPIIGLTLIAFQGCLALRIGIQQEFIQVLKTKPVSLLLYLIFYGGTLFFISSSQGGSSPPIKAAVLANDHFFPFRSNSWESFSQIVLYFIGYHIFSFLSLITTSPSLRLRRILTFSLAFSIFSSILHFIFAYGFSVGLLNNPKLVFLSLHRFTFLPLVLFAPYIVAGFFSLIKKSVFGCSISVFFLVYSKNYSLHLWAVFIAASLMLWTYETRKLAQVRRRWIIFANSVGSLVVVLYLFMILRGYPKHWLVTPRFVYSDPASLTFSVVGLFIILSFAFKHARTAALLGFTGFAVFLWSNSKYELSETDQRFYFHQKDCNLALAKFAKEQTPKGSGFLVEGFIFNFRSLSGRHEIPYSYVTSPYNHSIEAHDYNTRLSSFLSSYDDTSKFATDLNASSNEIFTALVQGPHHRLVEYSDLFGVDYIVSGQEIPNLKKVSNMGCFSIYKVE